MPSSIGFVDFSQNMSFLREVLRFTDLGFDFRVFSRLTECRFVFFFPLCTRPLRLPVVERLALLIDFFLFIFFFLSGM